MDYMNGLRPDICEDGLRISPFPRLIGSTVAADSVPIHITGSTSDMLCYSFSLPIPILSDKLRFKFYS